MLALSRQSLGHGDGPGTAGPLGANARRQSLQLLAQLTRPVVAHCHDFVVSRHFLSRRRSISAHKRSRCLRRRWISRRARARRCRSAIRRSVDQAMDGAVARARAAGSARRLASTRRRWQRSGRTTFASCSGGPSRHANKGAACVERLMSYPSRGVAESTPPWADCGQFVAPTSGPAQVLEVKGRRKVEVRHDADAEVLLPPPSGAVGRPWASNIAAIERRTQSEKHGEGGAMRKRR